MAQAAAIAGELSDRLETDRYDCILELTPAKALNKNAAVRVVLEAKAEKASLLVVLTKTSIVIYKQNDGRKSQVAKVTDPGIVPGAPYRLTIMRRETTLGLLHGNTLLYRGDVPRGPGDLAGVTMDTGWVNTSEPRIQRLEPMHFEDDFMRAGTEQGLWVKQSGIWELKTAWDKSPQGSANAKANAAAGYGQNPFAMVGSSRWDKNAPNSTKPAVTTAGDPFWEDYTFSVAVQPEKDTVLGMLVNMTDANNGLLVRWTPFTDHEHPGRLTLNTVENGQAKEVITGSPGGFIPQQWYRLTVISSLTGVTVLVDGVERISKTNITPWRGGIGLYAEGFRGVLFDDVKVFGRTFDADLLFETQQTDMNKRFETDPNGMASWANSKSEWLAAVGQPGHFWFIRDIFGDHQWMALSVKPMQLPTGELWMTLNGDGKTPTGGLRAVAQVTPDPAKVTYTLYQDEKVLASKKVTPPPTSDAEYAFRFWRAGTDIWLEVDGEIVVKAGGVKVGTGLRPAYRATGCFAGAHDQVVLSRNMLDYSFSNAPTDWLYDGAWEPTVRWSCSPNWSFLGGWSRGDAVMWHKQYFTGDQAIETFFGVKMEYPRQRDVYDNRYHDFNLTICGDGRNPRSGYTGIYVTTEKKVALYRNGVELIAQALPPECIPSRGGNHRSWFNPELRKRGNTIEFTVTFAWLPPQKDAAGNVTGPRTITLSYTDEHPIAGGVPAVWTSNNGITIARTRIDFATPPKPRTEPLLILPQPWYPEWANVGEPLTLDLSDIRSTSGKPARLVVTPRGVPAADESAVKTDGTRLIFTPRQADQTLRDNHWYEVKATDGEIVSPSIHLDLHVFDPKSHKRDDSHAQVLYRFNEGKGDIVRDQSGKAPGADLKIMSNTVKGEKNGVNPDNLLTAQWLPGQGLLMRHDSQVLTERSAGMDRLLQAIGSSHACAIEFWVSIETIYPPNKQDLGYTSTFFSWDFSGNAKENRRNLSLVQHHSGLALYPRDVPVALNANYLFAGSIGTGLMHMLISWDGTKTSLFSNGVFVRELTMPWNVEKMTTGSQFILGNTLDAKLPYFGTFYLLAFHDKAFTAEEAKRHYLAGPSGQSGNK